MGYGEKTKVKNRGRGDKNGNNRRVRVASTTASEGTHIGLD